MRDYVAYYQLITLREWLLAIVIVGLLIAAWVCNPEGNPGGTPVVPSTVTPTVFYSESTPTVAPTATAIPTLTPTARIAVLLPTKTVGPTLTFTPAPTSTPTPTSTSTSTPTAVPTWPVELPRAGGG